MSSDEKIDELSNKMDIFSDAFQKVSLTLIAKMTEIADALSRIAAETELLGKIKSQNAENTKAMEKIDNLLTALNRRLDKLSEGGFRLPTMDAAPAPQTKAAPPPLQEVSSPDEESLFSMPATPSAPDEPIEDKIEGLEIPAEEGEREQTLTPPPEPPAGKKGKEKGKEAKGAEAPKKGKEKGKGKEAKSTPVEEGGEENEGPVLQISDPSNPSFQIMQNLSIDVNACKSSEDIGKAFLRAKDALTSTIKFHPALFDLIKVGNDYIRKKPKIDAKFVKEVQGTIETVYKKLGGT